MKIKKVNGSSVFREADYDEQAGKYPIKQPSAYIAIKAKVGEDGFLDFVYAVEIDGVVYEYGNFIDTFGTIDYEGIVAKKDGEEILEIRVK